MAKVTVSGGRTILVSGPASLALIEGEASVLGAPIEKSQKIVVREERQIPVETLRDSIFHLSLGEKSKLIEFQGSTIPTTWKEAADAVMQMESGITIVIGDVDTGKTTFCTYLANSLLKTGVKVALIDADIGQADVGPPTTISLTFVEDYTSGLSSLSAKALFFTGHISPSPVMEKVIHGIEKLVALQRSSPHPAVINTDGWVADERAVAYKLRMANAVSPDLAVGIGNGPGVQSILENVKATSIRIESPSIIRRRSREERRQLRERGYRKYLEKASPVVIPLDRVDLRFVSPKQIRVVSMKEVEEIGFELGVNAVYAEETADRIAVYTKGLPRAREVKLLKHNLRKEVEFADFAEKQHSIIGLLDEEDFLLSIGILKDVDPKRRVLKAYAVPNEKVTTVEVGAVKLTEEGKELAYLGD